jgi:hypothetical protein
MCTAALGGLFELGVVRIIFLLTNSDGSGAFTLVSYLLF